MSLEEVKAAAQATVDAVVAFEAEVPVVDSPIKEVTVTEEDGSVETFVPKA